MQILNDINIDFDAKAIVSTLNHGRMLPQLIRETEKAIIQAKDLVMPTVVYEWVTVEAVEGEQVVLAARNRKQRVVLNLGPHADLMAETEMALVSVDSIGSKIDEQVRTLNQAGQNLFAYLLDGVGVVALGKVGEAVRRLAEKEANRRNWGVGSFLGPGSLEGWPLMDQVELCSILPVDQIGIHFNSQGVLVPFKSASGIIGIGPGYQAKKVGSVCRYCLHRNTCWRSRDTKRHIHKRIVNGT